MASMEPTRIVIVAPDTLAPEPGDDAAVLEVERSRSLRIGLLQAGYNIVAVLPVDSFLPDRLAQLQPDMIIVDAESQARDTLEHVVMATREARRPIVMFTDDTDTSHVRGAIAAGVTAYVVAGLAPERVKPVLAVLMTLNNNGQAITLSKKLADKGAVDGAGLAKVMASEKRDYTFAQTFPTGTHAMWLYYWMASVGINPLKDAKVITVPPPQTLANMRVGNMDGYCVGEPWNHRAIINGIGVTAVTPQDIWKDHPEKVLGTTGEFVKKYPNTARAVTMAVMETGHWIDASLQNKNKMAETIADKSYVNTSVDAINQRILGRYQNGQGKTWDDPDYMKFFNDGA